MQVVIFHQLVPHLLGGAAIGEHAVRQHHAHAPAGAHDRHDVLQEVHLIVAGLDKLRAVGRYLHAALGTGAEGRIGQDHLIQMIGGVHQGILIHDGALLHANVVEVQVHGGQRDHQGGVVRTEEGVVFEEPLLFHVPALDAHVLIRRQQEAARAAAGVRHRFGDLRVHHVHHGGNQGAGREILSRPALFVLAVLFQDFFVDRAFQVAFHHVPVIFRYHVDDLFQHHRAVDLVDGTGENGFDQAIGIRQVFEDFIIFFHQVVAAEITKVFPFAAFRQITSQAQRFLFVVHFQEQDVGELGDVIRETHPRRGQHVGDVPHLGEQGRFGFLVLFLRHISNTSYAAFNRIFAMACISSASILAPNSMTPRRHRSVSTSFSSMGVSAPSLMTNSAIWRIRLR